jgi:putative addiction module killer protein
MPQLLEYLDQAGKSAFGSWFENLNAPAMARITNVVQRLGRGLRPDVEPVGQGVFESKIHFGPGYRIYFGIDGPEIIILLGGGDKTSQPKDIAQAKVRWADYNSRKNKE